MHRLSSPRWSIQSHVLLVTTRLVPLSEGRIETDGTLQCAYHGWRFNAEGTCTTIPQAESSEAEQKSAGQPRACVASYPVQVCRLAPFARHIGNATCKLLCVVSRNVYAYCGCDVYPLVVCVQCTVYLVTLCCLFCVLHHGIEHHPQLKAACNYGIEQAIKVIILSCIILHSLSGTTPLICCTFEQTRAALVVLHGAR